MNITKTTTKNNNNKEKKFLTIWWSGSLIVLRVRKRRVGSRTAAPVRVRWRAYHRSGRSDAHGNRRRTRNNVPSSSPTARPRRTLGDALGRVRLLVHVTRTLDGRRGLLLLLPLRNVDGRWSRCCRGDDRPRRPGRGERAGSNGRGGRHQVRGTWSGDGVEVRLISG